MLKLLKWIYELGAENENRRVRGIINGIDAYSQAQIGVYRYEFDAPDTRESRRKALDREINDLNVKMQIIEAITTPNGRLEEVMFSPIDRPKAKK